MSRVPPPPPPPEPPEPSGSSGSGAEGYRAAKELLLQLLELAPERRAEALERAAAADAALGERVRRLLAAHDDVRGLQPGRFAEDLALDVQAALGAGPRAQAAEALPSNLVPGFTLIRRLAVGGMGAVYEAEQERPRRRVAIKVLRPELAQPETVRRLEHEAEVLARLEHPRIARLFASGRTPSATGELPYLVLEYVDGVPITDYAPRLPGARERMDLLARTAAAVADAHAAGVIHRDLKPSNVLVDAQGRPKVLDFGIARLAAAPGSPSTMHTQAGLLLGTLAYMSPEQARGDVAHVDTRSDVYALGAIGYELLTGRTPHDVARLPLAAAVRLLAEEPAPSLTLHRPDLRGDIAAVLGKALEHDPARRYQGAAAFADDLRAWIAGQPVQARPPSPGYLLGSYLKRHWVPVVAASAVFVALLVAAVVSFGYAVHAGREAERADRRTAEAEQAAYEAAMLAALRALDDRDRVGAREALEHAPAALRGWEWRHAWSQVDATASERAWPEPIERLLSRSRDGTHLLARAADGDVLLLRIDDGQVVRRLEDPGGGAVIEAGVLLADGREALLAARGSDVARHVRLEDGHVLGLLPALGAPIERLFVEVPDARVVLAGPQRLARWQVGSPALEPLAELREPRVYHALVAAPDAGLLALGSSARDVELWRGSEREALRGHDDVVLALDMTPDRRFLATGSTDRSARVYDLEARTWRAVFRGHGAALFQVALAPDGSLLATYGGDGVVRVWDVAAGSLRASFRFRSSPQDARITFLDQGRTLQMLHLSGCVRWSMTPSEVHTVLDASLVSGVRAMPYVYALAWSPDGTQLVSGSWDHTLRLWEVAGTRHLAQLDGQGPLLGVDWAPDGRSVLGVSRRGAVLLYDVATQSPRASRGGLATVGPRNPCAFSPDGTEVLVLTRAEEAERLVVDGLRSVATLASPGGAPTACAYAEQGRAVLLGTAWGSVARLDAATGRVGWSVKVAERPVACVVEAPDGQRVAVASEDGTLVLLRSADGARLAQLAGPGEALFAVAFSPDGARLVSGGRDRVIRIYDARSGRLLGDLRGHQDYVHDLAFSPDGQTLASASGDGTLRLWGTRTLRERIAAQRR